MKIELKAKKENKPMTLGQIPRGKVVYFPDYLEDGKLTVDDLYLTTESTRYDISENEQDPEGDDKMCVSLYDGVLVGMPTDDRVVVVDDATIIANIL